MLDFAKVIFGGIGLGNVAVAATLVGDLLSRRGLKGRAKHVDVYNTCAKLSMFAIAESRIHESTSTSICC